MFFKKVLIKLFLISIIFAIPFFVNAGTIVKATSTDGYAWGENVGWINFGTTEGNVQITDTSITGYAWDSIYGWINLSPTGSGVTNDGNGNLSGFAWSQGAGFIDFTGVSINSSGKFIGQAYGAIYGRINFNCSTCNVVTDWRVTTPVVNNPGAGSALLIVDTRSTTTIETIEEEVTVDPEEVVIVDIPSTVTPSNNIPDVDIEDPGEYQPVIDTDGLPTIETPSVTPGKTFVSQPEVGRGFDVNTFLNSLLNSGKKLLDDTKKFINTKEGDIITKSISTFGLVSAMSVPFVTFSFADVWLMWLRFVGLLMGALGLKKKMRKWGTVYDSVTKRPLDPVYVSLISIETGKEVAGAITDIDGRYGFLVLPGKYRIEAKKTNYIQPSVKMKGKSYDEVYNDLYFGEELTITQEGETITKNIPMDSLSFDWNEFAKTKMNVNKFTRQKDITWAKLSKLVFVIGALVSIIAVVAAPQPYNYIIVGFYFLAYILNFIVFKSKKSGTLTEKDTRAPLSFAIVKIYREGETVPLTKKIADKFGAYYALVPRGNYYISVEKKMDDGTYVEIFRSGVAEIKSGVIDEDLVL